MTERGLFSVDASAQGGPYSPDDMRLYAQGLLGDDDGVLRGELSEYAVTINGSDLRTASGRGLVNGFLAESDANIDKTPTVPAIGTTGLRIVVQKIWNTASDIETHIELLEAADGTATPPAVTQTDGTKWEISLATAEITTGGVIQALFDARAFIEVLPTIQAVLLDMQASFPLWAHFSGVFAAQAPTALVGEFVVVEDAGAQFATATEQGQVFTLGTTGTSDVGAYCGGAVFKTAQRIIALATVTPSSVATQSWVCGLATSGPVMDEDGNASFIGFFVSGTGALTARTRAVSTNTDTATSVTPDGATEFQLRIEIDAGGGEVRFYVDGVLEAVHTTNIPASNVPLQAQCGARSGGSNDNAYCKHMDVLQAA